MRMTWNRMNPQACLARTTLTLLILCTQISQKTQTSWNKSQTAYTARPRGLSVSAQVSVVAMDRSIWLNKDQSRSSWGYGQARIQTLDISARASDSSTATSHSQRLALASTTAARIWGPEFTPSGRTARCTTMCIRSVQAPVRNICNCTSTMTILA
jgi:hypothetical protein